MSSLHIDWKKKLKSCNIQTLYRTYKLLQLKDIIFNNLTISPQESPLKLVFTTIALGMDADLRHEVRVIHVGPPKNLEGESLDMYNFHTLK